MKASLRLRPAIIAVVLVLPTAIAAAQSSAPATAPVVDQHGPAIKEACAKFFSIGMAGDIPGHYSETELGLVKDNFTVVTPGKLHEARPRSPRRKYLEI